MVVLSLFQRCTKVGGGAREMAVGEKKGKKKEKQSTSSHLKMAYRPGNANYRIQKVSLLVSMLYHRMTDYL